MKKVYTDPKAEMIEFDTKDVITTSGGGDFNSFPSIEGEASNGILDWSTFH